MRRTQDTVLDEVRDAAIEFEEEGHKYFINGVEVPQSCYSSFNRDENARNSAAREHGNLGLSIEDAKFYILTKYNYDAYFCIRVHRKIEKFLKNINEGEDPLVHIYEPGISEAARQAFERDHPLQDVQSKIEMTVENFRNFYEDRVNYELIASEYMVWDQSFRKNKPWAGTIDAIFWSNKAQGCYYGLDHRWPFV